MLYISHRLDEIFSLADRVTVLRDGRKIDTLDVKDVDRRKLIEMMVGRKVENEYPKKTIVPGKVLLEVRKICQRGVFHDISFTLREGEILGIAGLVGAGRTELVRAIFGADKKTSGTLFVHGKFTAVHNVPQAISHSMGLVPEERKTQGLILGMTVKENISLVGLDLVLKKGIINENLETSLAQKYINILRIVTPNENREVRYLSGGNQQKVVLAKWLAVDSDILFFDEPTRGIDVGAKVEIYKLLSEMASKGKGIIMVSSELPELIGMCDRILVMHEGRMTGEVMAQEASQELIMEYATKYVADLSEA
jgi:ABC-type sugar transport system ATPase subunit